MFSHARFLFLGLLVLLYSSAASLAQQASSPRVIRIQGTELTGLNAPSLTVQLRQIRDRGITALVLDLGGITRLTEAGLEALMAGVALFGAADFAVAGLSGEAANLASTRGGGLRLYPSVEAALAGFGH